MRTTARRARPPGGPVVEAIAGGPRGGVGSASFAIAAARRGGSSAVAGLAILAASSLAAGCDPVLDLGGSFFPAWMPCLVVGAIVATLAHLASVRAGLEPHLGPRPLIYGCLVALGTMTTWLIFFRT